MMATTTPVEMGSGTYSVNPLTGVLEEELIGQNMAVAESTSTDAIQMDSEQLGQAVIGHEVEVVSVDPIKMPRPFQTSSKPSLLRRGPRTSTVSSHITAYPPQISPSVLSRFGQINQPSISPTASYLASSFSTSSYSPYSQQPSASSSYYQDRKPTIIHSSNRGGMSTSVANAISSRREQRTNDERIQASDMEEIVIWQPGEEDDCEIVEVDEAQLQHLFHNQSEEYEEEDSQELELSDSSILDSIQGQNNSAYQQIVVYDGQNIQLSDLLSNYMNLQVIESDSGRRLKLPKVSRRKLNTELKCQEEGCTGFVHNVIDLRKHLQNQHNFELDEETVTFANDEEFKLWRANYERDRKVSFIYRGGTKKISPEKAVTYLICHRSGIYKPTPGAASDRKRKMKPQGSCKIGTHCTAGVKLLKNLINGTTDATICHTHYGHELENIQHLRVNATIKEIILGKFEEGLTFTEVLQYVHHNPDGLEGLRVVDRRAIRNIYDQWKKAKDPPHPNSLKVEQTHDEKDALNESIPDAFIQSTTEVVENESTQSALEGGIKTSTVSVNEVDSSLQSENSVCDNNTMSDIKIEKTESLATPSVSNSSLTTTANKRKSNKSPKAQLPVKSLNEAVHYAIEKLLDHGESGPTVLFYKRADIETPIRDVDSEVAKSLEKNDLCVILQTPVQRQLLQMFGKVLYVDVVVGTDLDLMVLAVLDEFLTAIPVAWMISSEICSNHVDLCFQCIKDNCVEVKCEYFYSHKNLNYHKLWCKYFTRKPRLMLSQEETIRDFGILIKRHVDDEELRNRFTTIMETLVTTPDRKIYEDNLKTLKLKSSPLYKILSKDWLLNKSQWAFHTRYHIPYPTEDSFARLKKFVLFKGTKKISHNIDNVLKIGYDRCFQRNKNLFKGDLRFHQTLDLIQKNHDSDHGAIIKIQQLDENIYLVQDTYKVYDVHSECKCRIRCESCGVCAHRYWCTCPDNLNFCSHAHQVCVFSKPNWPVKTEVVDESTQGQTEYKTVHLIAQEMDEVKQDQTATPNVSEQLEEFLENDNEVHEISNSNLTEHVPESEAEPADDRRIIEAPTPEIPAPEPSIEPRRISSRVKQKVARPLEDVFEPISHKRTRRTESEYISDASTPKTQPPVPATNVPSSIITPPSSSTTPTPVPKKKPGRPSKKSGPPPVSQDDVKEEIKKLLNKIEGITDDKVLADIKKGINDILGSLI